MPFLFLFPFLIYDIAVYPLEWGATQQEANVALIVMSVCLGILAFYFILSILTAIFGGLFFRERYSKGVAITLVVLSALQLSVLHIAVIVLVCLHNGELKKEAKQAAKLVEYNNMPLQIQAPAKEGSELVERLNMLRQLRADGILSEFEYNRAVIGVTEKNLPKD